MNKKKPPLRIISLKKRDNHIGINKNRFNEAARPIATIRPFAKQKIRFDGRTLNPSLKDVAFCYEIPLAIEGITMDAPYITGVDHEN